MAMAIPTSTIVMTLVTCVPFGLAVRDTINGNNGARSGADLGELEDELEADYAMRQRAIEQELAAEETARDEQLARLGELHGAEPASLGSVFEDLRIGASAESIGAVMAGLHRYERATRTRIRLEQTGGKLVRVSVEPSGRASDGEDDRTCSLLTERLNEAWGDGLYGSDGFSWFDPDEGVRATLSAPCRYIVERYVPASDWFDPASKTSVVPVWALGQPAQRLIDTLGDDAYSDASQVRWSGPAMGTSLGGTELVAAIKGSKIVGLRATLRATQRDVEEDLEELLGEHYGEGTTRNEADDETFVVWKLRPQVTLRVTTFDDDARLVLTVGAAPRD